MYLVRENRVHDETTVCTLLLILLSSQRYNVHDR
jgi:hypothetical protein